MIKEVKPKGTCRLCGKNIWDIIVSEFWRCTCKEPELVIVKPVEVLPALPDYYWDD